MTRGKGVLNQKSELQRAMQKHQEVQSRKELEKERQSTRSALEITLEKRARRLEEVNFFYHSLKPYSRPPGYFFFSSSKID